MVPIPNLVSSCVRPVYVLRPMGVFGITGTIASTLSNQRILTVKTSIAPAVPIGPRD